MEKRTSEVFVEMINFISEFGVYGDCIRFLLSKGIDPIDIRDAFNAAMQKANCSDRFTTRDCEG